MPEQDPQDILAATRAVGDQAKAEMAELARALVTFRRELVDGGFDPTTADAMTMHYFGVMLRGGPHA